MDKEAAKLFPHFLLERDFLCIHLRFISYGVLPQVCDKHRGSSSLQLSFFNEKYGYNSPLQCQIQPEHLSF